MASVTFQVNLETPSLLAHSQPVSPTDTTVFRDTRSTWLPNYLVNNRALKDGDQFTVTSSTLIKYLKDTYTTGDDPLLEVVS